MRITVFGATGRVGRLVVDELLANDHTVTAFVHRTQSSSQAGNLLIVQGDINNRAAIEKAITGSDAVISALGSWGTSTKNILSTGMRNIIPVMEGGAVKRIISLTGADARLAGDKIGLVHGLTHPVLKVVAGRILYDGEEHLRLLSESDLRWTVVRSPIMNDRGRPEDYVLSDKRPLPWSTISRRAVAHSLVELLRTEQYDRRAPFITRH